MGRHAPLYAPQSISPRDKGQVFVMCRSVREDSEPYAPPQNLKGYPRGLLAKRFSIIGLGIAWIAGLTGLIIGIAYTIKSFQNNNEGWIPVNLTRNTREVIPLLLNVIIVILEYSMGFIHTAALRWALIERAKVSNNGLTFNSNLRLFRYPRGYLSLGLLSNILNGSMMALTYTAASFMFGSVLGTNTCKPEDHCTDRPVYWCPSAVLALGLGLLTQAFLTTCQLNTVKIYSWNSSPIATAWACVAEERAFLRPGRCMTAVLDNFSDNRLPKERQQPVYFAHKQARQVLRYLWAVVVYCLLWFIILYLVVAKGYQLQCETGDGCTITAGNYWSFTPDSRALTTLDLAQIDYEDPFDYTPGAVTESAWQGGMAFAIFLYLVTIMGFQAMLTMGLHCAELLVNLSRDEETWRRAGCSSKGYKDQNAIISAIISWKTMLLFAAKPAVHWMFGLAIQFYYAEDSQGIFLHPPQTLYLSITWLLLAVYGTCLCLKKQKGPQPATYGHIQTLVDLIDVYDNQLFWGDKTKPPEYDQSNMSQVRHAGTWGRPLPAVQFNVSYA